MKDTFRVLVPSEVNLSVELVNLQTKEPFKEHTNKEGQVFVEVEPEAEYAIAISCDSKDRIMISYEVDGKSLGYHSFISSDMGTSYKGLFSCKKNEGGFMTALKFSKAIAANPVVSNGNEKPWMGNITLSIYKSIINPYKIHIDEFTCDLKPKTMDAAKNNKVDKLLLSEVGSTTRRLGNKSAKNWDKGEFIKKIKIIYCSTVGLIHAGILRRPDHPTGIASPQKRSSTSEEQCGSNKARKVTPTKLTKQFKDSNGAIISKTLVDMYDLTMIEEDEDEEQEKEIDNKS